MLTRKNIKAYNNSRAPSARDKLCHAPFSNLNFEQNGNVTACCFNRKDVLGKYPRQSIQEIWKGREAQSLRKKIKSANLDGGCKLCRILIEGGNYSGTKAIHYDDYAEKTSDSIGNKLKNLWSTSPSFYPKVFEFEISNTCNLECEMCNGYFSSTIRKNREKLPPIKSPYDDEFVSQVAGFMPYLTDLKFLGGEPFLIDIYYKIWEKVVEINPDIKIHITTNGTVLNKRVKRLLSSLKAGIVISLDSIDKEEFESIRCGANFEQVMENFDYFHELAKQKNTYLSIAACAMTNNWKGIPELVRFANNKNVSLHFNVVWNPGYLSMRYLDHSSLEEIESYFKSQVFTAKNAIQKSNIKSFNELIQTVKHWKHERNHTLIKNPDRYFNIPIKSPEALDKLHELNTQAQYLSKLILSQYLKFKDNVPQHPELERIAGIKPENGELHFKDQLFEFWKSYGDTTFLNCYFDALILLGKVFHNSEFDGAVDKARDIKRFILNLREQQAVISDFIDELDRKSILFPIEMLLENDTEILKDYFRENY